MHELGDTLTPEQVIKMLNDAALLMMEPPETILDPDGEERPLGAEERERMAKAFLDGSIGRLAQWWRAEDEESIGSVIEALDEGAARMLAFRAVSFLGDMGFTIAARPGDEPADPRLN
jgi:hypothetical protein